MEKFVIEGGVPLSRHRHARREQERRAADPGRVGPDDDEVVVAQRAAHPRRRGDARRARRPRRARSSGAPRTRSSICAAGVDREAQVDRELAERIRASFLLAGPLLARFGRADMPPPGGDVIGRRRLDPHLDAFRALGATLRARPRHRPRRAQRRPARRRGLHGRAVGHGDRERADGRRADARHDRSSATPRASPTSRTSRGCSSRWAPTSAGIGSNVLTVSGSDELGGCTHDVGPDHIEIGSFMALAGVTGGELRDQGHRARGPAHDPARLRRAWACSTELDGADVIVPGDQQLIAQRDVGEYKAKVQDGPWPAFPADLTSIADRPGHPVQRLGPHPRVDVREPHDLHRQARARWAPTSRSATRTARSSPGPAACAASAWSRRTSAPAWRCSSPRCAPRGAARSATSARSTAATSASTSACATSAAQIERVATRARRAVLIHRIPSGTRDVLPDEMRELRAITDALRGVFERHGYGEVYTPALEYESVAAPRRRRRAAGLPRVRRPRRRARAARGHDGADRAASSATRYQAAEPPLRFCYVAHAYRGVTPAPRPDARVPAGRDRARRRPRRRRAPPRR